MEYQNLTHINKLKTNELWIVQPKWYKSNYELTDNAFVYAKIYNQGFWQGTTLFETADEVLSIKKFWTGSFEITNAEGSFLGTVTRKTLSSTVTLTLNNGRTFIYSAPSIWKSEYVWTDEYNNELLRMDFGSFSGKVSLSFAKRAAEIPNFSALVFLAFKLKMENAGHG
ncbi:hypothetical protein [Mucilaginibacter sp. HD30]